MIILTDPDIRCNADRTGAETHMVLGVVDRPGDPIGNYETFSVLTHGGRRRAQELADAYTVQETGYDVGTTNEKNQEIFEILKQILDL